MPSSSRILILFLSREVGLKLLRLSHPVLVAGGIKAGVPKNPGLAVQFLEQDAEANLRTPRSGPVRRSLGGRNHSVRRIGNERSEACKRSRCLANGVVLARIASAGAGD